jgi:D-sedoheptulose 7-phosphate isomerase
MSFPDSKFANIVGYAESYFAQVAQAAASVDGTQLQRAVDILTRVYTEGGVVYSCGNGGSAAIANHLVCDHCKLVRADTELQSRIVSLSTTVEVITAIGNDISFDEIFVYQLRCLAKPGDVLITISSSGDSENIVRTAQWAKDNDC